MPSALFVSPHLDDVAFSCGGTMAALAAAGWRTHLATVFTATVPDPAGFALACQLDKGLAPEVDYMALRRAEDGRFATAVGAASLHHLPHVEAPHRGYGSAAALFGPDLPGDDAWRAIAGDLAELVGALAPDLVLAPQGLGNHVDHRQVIRAVLALPPGVPVLWYRDTPYVLRDPDARPADDDLASLPVELAVDVTPHLATKLDATAAYASQLGFQFGGEPAMREALAGLARAEARRLGFAGVTAAETLLAAEPPAAAPGLFLPAAAPAVAIPATAAPAVRSPAAA